MNLNRVFIAALFISGAAFSQTNKNLKPTTSQERWQGYEQRLKLKQNSILQNLEFRSVGPTAMSGRITDIDANPDKPSEFYAAFASGGLWYTNNAGTTFTPVFDNEAVMSIGDIAVDWKSGTIYVGTGEANSSRSSYSGMGIYKSTNGGKTWENLGLKDSQHIGRIIINPNNVNEVWVAAVGHLYSPNSERGIFKTVDGGKTWKKTLYNGENTGGIDLQINPKNPKEVYAAMWERNRKAWNFVGNGTQTGIYKSTDGGEKWTLLTTQNSGFPTGKDNGRIGIAVSPSNPDIIYAILDNQATRPKSAGEKAVSKVLDKARMKKISKEEFMDLDEKDINAYLDDEQFPDRYTAKQLKELLKQNKIKVQDIYNYTHNGNDDLFDIQIEGAEVYRSDNGGKNWRKTHDKNLDGLFYTYGYYFSPVWVSPTNPDKVVIGGVPIVISENGGKSFKDINEDNVHADHHALWINPKDDNFMINGNDGGINVTYDSGKNWKHLNPIAVGQFYDVDYDTAKPYNVYGGLQDNGVWYGPSTSKVNQTASSTSGEQFKFLLGGDGMQARVDWRDNETVYTGFQFGNYFRINKKTNERKYLEMPREIGEPALRFNWEAPFNISRHNQDILYFGAQNVYRSMNKGNTWERISGDLTRNLPQGNVPFSTLTNIEESPKKFGLLYAGSDDGLVHISKDGGASWQKIMDKQGLWVAQIAPSKYQEGRVYVTLNGYREDHFAPYLFVSEDYGKSWKSLSSNLPAEAINVVREDPVNEDLLYVGTDHGVYVSLDRGQSFMSANNETLPQVAVHDLRIHHIENELIVGTHGRSIYIADVKPLQKMTPENRNKNVMILSDIKEIRYNKNWGKSSNNFNEIKEPEYVVKFYNKSAGNAVLNVYTDKDVLLKSVSKDVPAGFNSITYNYNIDAKNADLLKSTKADSGNYYLTPGKYKIEICINGNCEKKDVEVKELKPKTRREVPQGTMSPGEFKQWRRDVGYKKTL